jgi:HEAT repeat protein
MVWFAAVSRFATGYWVERLGATNVPGQMEPFMGSAIPRAALSRIGEAAIPRCIDELSSPDWRRRIGATQALRLYGDAASPAIPALIEAIRGPFDDPRSPWNGVQYLVRDNAITTLLQNQAGHDRARQLLTAAIAEALPPEPEPLIVRDEFSNGARRNDRSRRTWAAFALAQLDPGHADAMDVLADDLLYEDVAYRTVRRDKLKSPNPNYVGAFTTDGMVGYYHNRETEVRPAALGALLSLSYKPSWRTPARPATRQRLVNGLVQQALEDMSPSGAATDQRITALTVIAKMGASARDAASALAPLLARREEAVVRQARLTLETICPTWNGTTCPPD